MDGLIQTTKDIEQCGVKQKSKCVVSQRCGTG